MKNSSCISPYFYQLFCQVCIFCPNIEIHSKIGTLNKFDILGVNNKPT
jgi:hypothetical protein